MTSDERPGWQKSIGGYTFLELRSLSFFAAYLLTTSVISNLVQASSQETLQEVNLKFVGLVVLANLISFLGCLLTILIIKKAIARTLQRGLNLSLVLIISFLIGSIKGGIVSAVGINWGIFSSEVESTSSRWLQTGVLGMIVLPLLSLTVFKMQEISENSQALLRMHLNSSPYLESRNQSELNKQIQILVDYSSESLLKIEDQAKTDEPGARIAFLHYLDIVVEKHLRPISHKLWNAKSYSSSQFTAYWALGQITRASNYSWLVSTALLFLTLFISYFQLYPLDQALISASLSTALPMLLAQTFRLVPKNNGLARFGLISLGALIGVLIAWTIAAEFGFYVDTNLYGLTLVVHWLLILQNVILVSLASSIFYKESELRSEVEALIERDRLNLQALKLLNELERRHLAEHLHSEVQNRLLATALHLNSETAPELGSSLRAVRSAIKQITTFQVSISPPSWLEIKGKLLERWGGFLSTEIEIDKEILNSIPIQGTFEMLNESIANSLRHGLASSILIRVEVDRSNENCLNVEIRDNGIGVRAGKMGLGHKLVNALSSGQWQFTDSTSGGAVLKLQLAGKHLSERPRQESNLRPRD